MNRHTSKFATAALAVGFSLASLVMSPPAGAGPMATVKVRTQRMTDANLSSHQDGWYNPGDQLTLVCSKRGQNVKGFFSFNIPGGWDNLWYRTTDGHFVADVDIETGTLKDVTGDCDAGGPAPAAPAAAPSTTKVEAALARANSAVGTDMFGDIGCGKFVAWAYGVPGLGVNTALEFRDRLARDGRISMDQNAIPRGALVFSQSSWDGGAGHIDIAQGDGTFVSGGVWTRYPGLAGAGHTVQVMNSWNPAPGAVWKGWAVAPW